MVSKYDGTQLMNVDAGALDLLPELRWQLAGVIIDDDDRAASDQAEASACSIEASNEQEMNSAVRKPGPT